MIFQSFLRHFVRVAFPPELRSFISSRQTDSAAVLRRFGDLIVAVGPWLFQFQVFTAAFCAQCFLQTVLLRTTKPLLMYSDLMYCKLHKRAQFHGCVKLLYKSF